jgi:hypothetical protein
MWLRDELAALDPQPSDLRKFAWVFGGALVALAALFWYKGSPIYPYLAVPGALVALVGTVAPRILRGLYFVWMAVGLGTIVTAIILTIVFVVAITPIGLVMRLLGKDPLNRELDPEAKSYWIPKTHLIEDKSRYEKYF